MHKKKSLFKSWLAAVVGQTRDHLKAYGKIGTWCSPFAYNYVLSFMSTGVKQLNGFQPNTGDNGNKEEIAMVFGFYLSSLTLSLNVTKEVSVLLTVWLAS